MGCLRHGRSWALCLILLVVSVARGLAQTSPGEVTGRVADDGGALTLVGWVTETRRVVIAAGSHVDLGTVLLKLGPGSYDPVITSNPSVVGRYISVLNRLFHYDAGAVSPEVLLRFVTVQGPVQIDPSGVPCEACRATGGHGARTRSS
jgi:hypothetical protein